MKKNIPTDIANELAGSSVFFQRRSGQETESTSSSAHGPAGQKAPEAQPSGGESAPSSNRDTVQPQHHETTDPTNKDTQPPDSHAARPATGHDTHHDAMPDETFQLVRKAVKQVGKEAATYRFTAEEKTALADIVYTCHRQSVRTSENEITRIAVNWLLQDYRQHGAASVLARMLESLHG